MKIRILNEKSFNDFLYICKMLNIYNRENPLMFLQIYGENDSRGIDELKIERGHNWNFVTIRFPTINPKLTFTSNNSVFIKITIRHKYYIVSETFNLNLNKDIYSYKFDIHETDNSYTATLYIIYIETGSNLKLSLKFAKEKYNATGKVIYKLPKNIIDFFNKCLLPEKDFE